VDLAVQQSDDRSPAMAALGTGPPRGSPQVPSATFAITRSPSTPLPLVGRSSHDALRILPLRAAPLGQRQPRECRRCIPAPARTQLSTRDRRQSRSSPGAGSSQSESPFTEQLPAQASRHGRVAGFLVRMRAANPAAWRTWEPHWHFGQPQPRTVVGIDEPSHGPSRWSSSSDLS